MLPCKHRLTKHRDIMATLRQGAHLTTPYTHIYYYGTAGPLTRVACVVSRKISTSAVRRHKYQRWLRDSARDFINTRTSISAYDMVWLAKPDITKLKNHKELQKNLTPYLEKL